MMADLFDYAPPPSYPAAPGWKDPDTSRRAADQIADEAPRLRGLCLDAIRAAPEGLTADEVAGRIGESILATRPRVTELLKDGKVRDSGRRRRNETGRSAKVWVIA